MRSEMRERFGLGRKPHGFRYPDYSQTDPTIGKLQITAARLLRSKPAMPPAARSILVRLSVLLAFCAGWFGCTMPLPDIRVGVDAISSPSAAGAQSFKLVPKYPGSVQGPDVHAYAIAAIKASLETKGMFESPKGTRPEMLVEFDYGVGHTVPLLDGTPVVEKFLHISARRYEEKNPAGRNRGEELWDVRTTLVSPSASVEHALPLLAAVAVDYIGRDTHAEQTVKIPRNSPTVQHVKEAMGNGAAKP